MAILGLQGLAIVIQYASRSELSAIIVTVMERRRQEQHADSTLTPAHDVRCRRSTPDDIFKAFQYGDGSFKSISIEVYSFVRSNHHNVTVLPRTLHQASVSRLCTSTISTPCLHLLVRRPVLRSAHSSTCISCIAFIGYRLAKKEGKVNHCVIFLHLSFLHYLFHLQLSISPRIQL